MKLFDARICLGRDTHLDPFQFSDIGSIGKMLDKYNVGKAFFCSFASYRLDFQYGNELTFEAAKADGRLIPCPAVIPDSGGEVGSESAFISSLIKRGARCVGFYPKSSGIALDKRVIGNLFRAIQKRRLPLAVITDEIDLMALALLASDYPRIPFIYVSPPYRNRNLLPIMKDVKNIFLTIDAPFAWNQGIEEITNRFGSKRLLFASNFPVSEPGVAISHLMYAEIKKRDLENIAFRNMDRLIKGVTDE